MFKKSGLLRLPVINSLSRLSVNYVDFFMFNFILLVDIREVMVKFSMDAFVSSDCEDNVPQLGTFW